MNKKKETKYNFEAVTIAGEPSIESLYLTAKGEFNIHDPELLGLDTEGHMPAKLHPSLCMGKCKIWVAAQRSRPQVASNFSKLIQDNNVQINLGSMKVVDTDIVLTPAGGSVDPLFLKKKNRYAREVANILLLHTTHKSYVEEWITSDKSRKIGIPYIACSKARELLSVEGNDNFLTRDKLFDKLSGGTKVDNCVLAYCSTIIYSSPSLLAYSVVDPEALAYYNKYKPQACPELKEIRFPSMTVMSVKIPRSFDNIWSLSIQSGQILGDTRKRGVVSTGYYRFDMPPSEVALMDEATDIINICRRYNYGAIKTSELNINLYRILVANGISVYTRKCNVAQPQGSKAGIYAFGHEKYFWWGTYTQESPKLQGKKPEVPPPILVDPKQEWFFNYVYIPREPDSNLNYIPSVRASDGKCIATNVQVQGVKVGELLGRFARAQVFRNWFIYTRISFLGQDPLRDWFKISWIYPRRRETAGVDLFADGEVIEVIVTDKDTEVYSSIEPVFAEPTMAENAHERIEEILDRSDDDRLIFIYRKLIENDYRFGAEDEMHSVMSIADLSVVCGMARKHMIARRLPLRVEEEEDSSDSEEVVNQEQNPEDESADGKDNSDSEADLFDGAEDFKATSKKKDKIEED